MSPLYTYDLKGNIIFYHIGIDFSAEIEDNTPINFTHYRSLPTYIFIGLCLRLIGFTDSGGKEMKKFVALLLILCLMLSITGCGASQPPQPSVDTAPKQEVSPTEYLPYEGETLTVLYMSGVQADAARFMAPEFEAVTGAKVQIIDFPSEEMHEAILLDLVSYIGTYDVINMDSQWDGEFAPYLESLENFISQDQYDMSVWIENVQANCGQWQDKLFGIPTSCMPHVFAYRTDLLPHGLPATWMEYRNILASVNQPANGVYAIAVSKASDQLANMFNYLLWSSGGSWTDEDWNATINRNETRSAFNHITAVKNLSDPACQQWGASDALQAFLEGKAAVCESCPLPEILSIGDDPTQSEIVGKWALSVIPYEKTGITTLTASDIAIPVGSQNKKLAWEWIKMYTSYEMQNKFYDEFTIFSPRKAFWEQEKAEKLSAVREALDYADCGWRIPAFQNLKSTISETLSSLLSMKIYPDTAIRKFDSELKALLENMPPEKGSKNYSH